MISPLGKVTGHGGFLPVASVASIVMSALFFVLARPGERPSLSSDPRSLLCGTDCYPAAHPMLLIMAAVCAVAGLIGLRIAMRRARK